MIGIVLALGATVALPQEWPLGLEREVDAGIYMQAVAEDHGWRVWRVETKDGIRCKAVKPAEGQSAPVPLGTGSALFGATPFLSVSRGMFGEPYWYSWNARYSGRVSVKYRKPGERFWTEPGPLDFNGAAIGEGPIEVVVTSWRYPALLSGHSEEAATLDLAGVEWAQAEVTRCDAGREPAT